MIVLQIDVYLGERWVQDNRFKCVDHVVSTVNLARTFVNT